MPAAKRNDSFVSLSSHHSEYSLDSQEALEELRTDLIRFYKVVDPEKLQEETKVNELVLWARKHGAHNLTHMMKGKYGVRVEDVDDSPQGWSVLRATIAKFYRKHDMNKGDEVDKIFEWTKSHGVFKLNERLVAKYGVPLQSITSTGLLFTESLDSLHEKPAAPGSPNPAENGVSKWRNKYRHLAIQQQHGNLTDELKSFYAKVDPKRPVEEIEKIVQYGLAHGRAAVNANLRSKYGKCLDHVKMVDGSTAEERAFNLRNMVKEFFRSVAGKPLTAEKEDAMVEWGCRNYEELNDHLTRTYGRDLLSLDRSFDPEELKLQLFSYFSIVALKNQHKKKDHNIGDLLVLASKDGKEALAEELLAAYGIPFSEAENNESARVLAEQAPKLNRLSLRRSIQQVMARTLGSKP